MYFILCHIFLTVLSVSLTISSHADSLFLAFTSFVSIVENTKGDKYVIIWVTNTLLFFIYSTKLKECESQSPPLLWDESNISQRKAGKISTSICIAWYPQRWGKCVLSSIKRIHPSNIHMFCSQNLWRFRLIQLRQKTKQVKASTAAALPGFFTFSLILTPHPVLLFHLQPCVKRKTARSTESVNTPAPDSTTVHVLQASMVTIVKVLCAWLGRRLLQAAGQVESRLGYLKRSCAIPQEFGALPWKRLLWWWIIVIIKTDTASPSLLQEPVAWCCE